MYRKSCDKYGQHSRPSEGTLTEIVNIFSESGLMADQTAENLQENSNFVRACVIEVPKMSTSQK